MAAAGSLRAEPGDDADVLAAVDALSRWRVLARSQDDLWLAVQSISSEDVQGWLLRADLRVLGNVDALPVSDSATSQEEID
ncbi:MAG: hypothetical protein KDD84_23330 [Caldilineaceae bacterium]|nr:hypothetical protein [Caldilineaceae bacterium]